MDAESFTAKLMLAIPLVCWGVDNTFMSRSDWDCDPEIDEESFLEARPVIRLTRPSQGSSPSLEDSDESAFDTDLWLTDEPDATASHTTELDLASGVDGHLNPPPDLSEEELPDPETLFLQMQRAAAEKELPDSEALFLQMQGRIAADELPDPEALFLQMQGRVAEEELPDSEALFLQMQGAANEQELLDPGLVEDFFESEVGFRQIPFEVTDIELSELDALAAQSPTFEEPLLAIGDLEPLSVESDLPNPEELFLQLNLEDDSDWVEPVELPDPVLLFEQMQADIDEESVVEESPYEPEPASSEPASLFSRWKAKFTREKKEDIECELPTPVLEEELLPEPAELFRRMQLEESFSQPTLSDFELPVESGDRSAGEPPPLSEVLDAFRAELEAEERARLDADLLGDLSGPERFAETVSDIEFKTGTSVLTPPLESLPPSLPERLPSSAKPSLKMEPTLPEEPLPALMAETESVAKASPPSPPQASPPSPVYQAAPRPSKRRLSRPADSLGEETVRVVPSPSPTAGPTVAQRWSRFRQRQKPLSRHALSIFTRQLAAMLKAGIPLHQAVSFCAESEPEAAPMLEDVCSKIESGFSLSGAFKEHRDSFDPVYVGLVHSGELSGRLNEMLEKLADMLEREIDLRKRMISVITYPSVLMAVSLMGTLGFIFFILPQITPLFTDLNVELPWPTRVLLGLRSVLLPAFITLIATLLLVWALKDKIKTYVRAKPALERRLASIPLSIPVLGSVYEKTITARVLYSLATMLEVGVTMNQALARSEGTSGNAYVAYRLARAREDLADGASVTECLQVNRVFPETALHLIAAGEESARLVEMFGFVAKHFDDEVEQAMNSAAGMLEPLIMVVMGVIVGFITIAAAMPTVQILEKFS